jgi:septum formation protein
LELLKQIGIRVLVHPVDIDEVARKDESPVDLVLRLALEKARCCVDDMIQQGAELPVLGSDTVVDINGEVLGKPVDAEQAADMLARLSGKTHNVHTDVVIVTREGEYSEISTSRVEFAELSKGVIQSYVATGESLDKAGAYAIQGIAGQFVKSLRGSYSGVMGLPLFETARLLAECDINTMKNKQYKE